MKKLLFLLTICMGLPFIANAYDAVVNPTPATGEFQTINEALSSINSTDSATQTYTIFIKNGVYNEMVKIEKPNIKLIGESQDNTIIEYDLAAGYMDKNGNKVSTTGSAIFVVNASDFIAENLTIRNSFDYPANQALAKDDPKRLKDSQAVAVLVNNNRDHVRFNHVTMEGYQDTLFVKDGSRTYITNSIISGHVDFIFGGGTLIINNSEIIARKRFDIDTVYGYITAPSTDKEQPYGLIIMNSRLSKEDGVPSKSFALGRPWHPTTTFDDGRYANPNAIGMSLFINNQIDDHIYGWDKMSGKDINGEVIWFMPEDSRFFEFNNQGKGAITKENRYLIKPDQAKQYNPENILLDWPEQLFIF